MLSLSTVKVSLFPEIPLSIKLNVIERTLLISLQF